MDYRHNARLQLALFTTNPVMYARFAILAGQIESETHFPRLADVPVKQRDDTVGLNVQRLLRNFVLPFAVIAITGTEAEIKHAAQVFRLTRKRVPTMLVMCSAGFCHMNTAFDVPCSAVGHPPDSHDIVGSVLLGREGDFPGYNPERFGEATYLPSELWQKPQLELVAEYVRRTTIAAPRRFTF